MSQREAANLPERRQERPASYVLLPVSPASYPLPVQRLIHPSLTQDDDELRLRLENELRRIAETLCQRFGCEKEDAIVALKLARGVFAQPAAARAPGNCHGRLVCSGHGGRAAALLQEHGDMLGYRFREYLTVFDGRALSEQLLN